MNKRIAISYHICCIDSDYIEKIDRLYLYHRPISCQAVEKTQKSPCPTIIVDKGIYLFSTNLTLASSSNPTSKKAPLICPPPTTAIRFTPNSVLSISTALARSIRFSPTAIQEMF